MNKFTYYFSLFTLLFSLKMHAQIPVNNECAGAIDLIYGNLISGSTSYATNSSISSSCESGFGDVWYKFIAPTSGEMYLYLGEINDVPLIHYTIYDDCQGTNEVTCGNNSNEILLNSLQAGATYYVRIEKIHLSCRNECDTNFTILASQNALTQDEFTINSIAHYPNPVKDDLTITSKQIMTKINIYNALGKELQLKTINGLDTKIDFSCFQSGVYFVKILFNKKLKTIKIIKN